MRSDVFTIPSIYSRKFKLWIKVISRSLIDVIELSSILFIQ
jgi:hypothetical protein